MRSCFVFLLSCSLATAQAISSYGLGTPGTGGLVPAAWIRGDLRVGSPTFAWQVTSGVGGASAALLVSPQPDNRSVLGVDVLVDLRSTVVLGPLTLSGAVGAGGQGAAQQSMPVPSLAALQGVTLFAQWLIVDGGASAGVSASDGVRATVRGAPAILGALDIGLETRAAASTVLPWSNVVQAIDITADGRVAIVTGPINTPAAIFDVTTSPATPLGPPITAYFLGPPTTHPRVPLAYCSAFDPARNAYVGVVAIDLDPNSARFRREVAFVAGRANRVSGRPAISGDGRFLAVNFATFESLFGSAIHVIDVDPASASPHTVLATLQQRTFAESVELSATGAHLYVVSASGPSPVRQIDWRTGAVVSSLALPEGGGVRIDPRGRWLTVVRSPSGQGVGMVDLGPNGAVIGQRTVHAGGSVVALALSPDGSQATIGSSTNYLTYDLATGGLVARAPAASGTIIALALR